MKSDNYTSLARKKLIIKKCHQCATILESYQEVKKCHNCKQAFMPSNYFSKVHATNSKQFENLFQNSDELHEDDLIKGLNVLW